MFTVSENTVLVVFLVTFKILATQKSSEIKNFYHVPSQSEQSLGARIDTVQASLGAQLQELFDYVYRGDAKKWGRTEKAGRA